MEIALSIRDQKFCLYEYTRSKVLFMFVFPWVTKHFLASIGQISGVVRPNPQFSMDLVTFTEDIIIENLFFVQWMKIVSCFQEVKKGKIAFQF